MLHCDNAVIITITADVLPFIKGEKKEAPAFNAYSDIKAKTNLEYVLKKSLKQIIAKYASYVDYIRNKIEEKQVNVKSLRSYLMSLTATSTTHELLLMSDKRPELYKAKDIHEIFDFLSTECCSFLNYEIFQNIVENYEISDNHEKLEYPKHLKDYMDKHKISEFVKINPLLKTRKYTKELTLKLDVESSCRLAKYLI